MMVGWGMNSGDGFFWSEINSMNCRDLAAFLANEISEEFQVHSSSTTSRPAGPVLPEIH